MRPPVWSSRPLAAVLAGSAMAAQCVLTGMGVMESRKRVFGKEFQERKEVKDLVESDEFKKVRRRA